MWDGGYQCWLQPCLKSSKYAIRCPLQHDGSICISSPGTLSLYVPLSLKGLPQPQMSLIVPYRTQRRPFAIWHAPKVPNWLWKGWGRHKFEAVNGFHTVVLIGEALENYILHFFRLGKKSKKWAISSIVRDCTMSMQCFAYDHAPYVHCSHVIWFEEVNLNLYKFHICEQLSS